MMRRALAVYGRLSCHKDYHWTYGDQSRALSSIPKFLSLGNDRSEVDERPGCEKVRDLRLRNDGVSLKRTQDLIGGVKNWDRRDSFYGLKERGLVTMVPGSSRGRRNTDFGLRRNIIWSGQRDRRFEMGNLRWNRTIRRSMSAGASKESGKEVVTWRQAVKSPTKAMQYMGQMRRSLVEWGSHMWSGAKLLAADVRGSWKVLKRILKGKQITRRERNFIVQTGVDLARLVPFSLFLIIPAAEFALPFALKIFPNMLPSQFQDEMKKEEDKKKNLKVKLELAKYLRDVVEEKAKLISEGSHVDSGIKKDAEDLSVFLEAIRKGEAVDPKDVPRFARLFNDEITIEGAVRPQLVAMSKYMGISPYGGDQFLRYKIRSRLNAIKNDDMQIMWEGGVESLADDEVIRACKDRGIRTLGSSSQTLRRQLAEWLALSQDKEIPGSLMIMSRAFFYVGEEGVKETLGSLPDDLLQDVKQAAGGDEVTNADRLDEVRRQEKLIAMEEEREARKEKEAAEAAQKKVEESLETIPVPQASVDTVLDPEEAVKAETAQKEVEEAIFGETVRPPNEEVLRDITEEKQTADTEQTVREEGEEELAKQKEAIRRVAESIGDLSAESAVEKERLALEELKSEVADAEAALSNIGEQKEVGLTRFKKLVQKLEREVEKVDNEVGMKMKLLDTDNDGVVSLEEASQVLNGLAGEKNERAVKECLRRLDTNQDGNFSREDLRRVLRELQSDGGVSNLTSTEPSPSQVDTDPGSSIPSRNAVDEERQKHKQTATVSQSTD